MCGITVVRMAVRSRARRITPRTEHVRNLSRFTDFMDGAPGRRAVCREPRAVSPPSPIGFRVAWI